MQLEKPVSNFISLLKKKLKWSQTQSTIKIIQDESKLPKLNKTDRLHSLKYLLYPFYSLHSLEGQNPRWCFRFVQAKNVELLQTVPQTMGLPENHTPCIFQKTCLVFRWSSKLQSFCPQPKIVLQLQYLQ